MFRHKSLTVVVFGIGVSVVHAFTYTAGFSSVNVSALAIISMEGEACGGVLGTGCAATEFCVLPTGSCNDDQITGICMINDPNEVLCSDVFTPVCGCDGNTYGNGCEAVLANANVDHDGECVLVNGSIPATSTWGVIFMTLIMMTFGTVILRGKAEVA